MPRVQWSGLGADDVDGFDRDSQIKPYAGPVPPDGMYLWAIKVLQHREGDRKKNPQLRVGLELVPRAGTDYKHERKYKGYFTMDFIPMADNTAFRYVPLLDVLGVTGKDLINNTITDEDGNIKKIGSYRHDGRTLVLAQLVQELDQNGNAKAQKNIRGGGYYEPPEDAELDDDELPEDDAYGADVVDEDYYEDDEEDERPKKSRGSGNRGVRSAGTRRGTTGSRRTDSRRTAGRVQSSRKRRPANDEDDF